MKGQLETPSLSHLSSDDYTKIYEPAEDSFLLIDALEKDFDLICDLKPLMCIEVGSGSGIVISALGKALGHISQYFATDINPLACLKTQETGYHNGVNIEIINTNLMQGISDCGKVDVIIFNPPYVVTPSEEVYGKTTDGDLTRAWAGGVKGREVMDQLLPHIPRLLSPHGLFYLVVIADNCPAQIETLMEQYGFTMCVVKERKIRGEHLFVLRFKWGKNEDIHK